MRSGITVGKSGHPAQKFGVVQIIIRKQDKQFILCERQAFVPVRDNRKLDLIFHVPDPGIVKLVNGLPDHAFFIPGYGIVENYQFKSGVGLGKYTGERFPEKPVLYHRKGDTEFICYE
jgi:hypothetical protein